MLKNTNKERKKIINFNQLTQAQLERLAILSEELGEAQQIIGKIIRHGYDSYYPNDPEKITNRQLLKDELRDIRVIVKALEHFKDIEEISLEDCQSCLERKQKYMHYNNIMEIFGFE